MDIIHFSPDHVWKRRKVMRSLNKLKQKLSRKTKKKKVKKGVLEP